jgi:hypothetical protein
VSPTRSASSTFESRPFACNSATRLIADVRAALKDTLPAGAGRASGHRPAPSIEKKYGKPISEWKALIRSSGNTKHMQLVTWLKEEHGVGHGHANALVADTLREDRG